MATLYVYHGGSNTAPYDSWANAATTLGTAVSAAAAGDTIIVASDHSEESSSGLYFTFPSSDPPVIVYSANRTTNLYEKALAAQIFSNGIMSSYVIIEGKCRCYGIWFKSKRNINLVYSSGDVQAYRDCIFEILGGSISAGSETYVTDFIAEDCKFHFNSTSTAFNPLITAYHKVRLSNCIMQSATTSYSMAPPIIAVYQESSVVVEGCDMSGAGYPILLKHNTGPDKPVGSAVVSNCSLHTNTTTLFDTKTSESRQEIFIYNVDAANVEGVAGSGYYGDLVQDSSIYRTNTSGVNGTKVSNAVMTTANAAKYMDAFRMQLWSGVVDTATAKTFTVEFAQDGTTTALTDEDIWIEVEYPDDTSTLGLFDTNRKASITDTAAAHPDSTESWTGLSGTNKRQKMSVTTTQTGKNGVCTVWLYVAKPSITVYVDPDVTVT